MKYVRKMRKLNKNHSFRKSLLKNLTVSLLKFEQIKSTTARIKELRRTVKYVITIAKRNTLQNIRKAFMIIRSKRVLRKLFLIIGPRFKNFYGGYTKILKCGFRKGDNAPLSIIQLLGDKK